MPLGRPQPGKPEAAPPPAAIAAAEKPARPAPNVIYHSAGHTATRVAGQSAGNDLLVVVPPPAPNASGAALDSSVVGPQVVERQSAHLQAPEPPRQIILEWGQ